MKNWFRSNVLAALALLAMIAGASPAHAASEPSKQGFEEAKQLLKKARHLLDRVKRERNRNTAPERIREAQGLLDEANRGAMRSFASVACNGLLSIFPAATLFVAQYLEAHRMAMGLVAIYNPRLVTPLTTAEKDYLKTYFPRRLLEGVRIFEGLAGAHSAFSDTTNATTYGTNFVMMGVGKRTDRRLKHEMVHVCQYDRYGTAGFAAVYLKEYIAANCDYATNLLEDQAFKFEEMEKPINEHLGYCE